MSSNGKAILARSHVLIGPPHPQLTSFRRGLPWKWTTSTWTQSAPIPGQSERFRGGAKAVDNADQNGQRRCAGWILCRPDGREERKGDSSGGKLPLL
jgi:hypothetical protein